MNLRETIKEITREHLENNGIVAAQNLAGVGCLNNTFPAELTTHKGVWELPTSDSSNGGIMCGAALGGRPTMYVIRFGGFLWYNAVSIVNYAAKSKELWDVPCPLFTRVMSCEGGIGPVAGGMHHSMVMRMPGIKVVAPMTPNEYREIWADFKAGDDPMLCSEHRRGYDIDKDFDIVWMDNPQYTIVAIGAARIEAYEAVQQLNRKGLRVSIKHLVKLAPLEMPYVNPYIRKAYVIDDDYIPCSASSYVAYEIAKKYNVNVEAMGLENRSAGFSPDSDNTVPTAEQIVNKILDDNDRFNRNRLENLY